MDENIQPKEERIGEEIGWADDNVSIPAEKTGKSLMIPIVIVVVVIALGAAVSVKKEIAKSKKSKRKQNNV